MKPDDIATAFAFVFIGFTVGGYLFIENRKKFKILADAISGTHIKGILSNSIHVGDYILNYSGGTNQIPQQITIKRTKSEASIGEVYLEGNHSSENFSVHTINCPIPDSEIPCELTRQVFKDLKGCGYSFRINQFECTGYIFRGPEDHETVKKMIASTEALYAHFLELSQ